MSKLRKALYASSIVSMPRGSWKWQDAYSKVIYGVRRSKDGRLLWKSLSSSEKLSEPQIRKRGISYDYRGGLHNQPIGRSGLAILLLRAHSIYGTRTSRGLKLAARLIPGVQSLLEGR